MNRDVFINFRRSIVFVSSILLFASISFAQKPEISLTLNEQFVDAALDAVLQKGEPPSIRLKSSSDEKCRESIRLSREVNGVRTAVRFREGRIFAPIAFSGSYSLPIIGCIDFTGWTETEITLEFDAAGQRILARAKVVSVNLNGVGTVGSTLLTRLIQSSVDERVNPIELLRLDRLSFVFPIQDFGSVRLNATGFRYAVQNGQITFFIPYDIIRN